MRYLSLGSAKFRKALSSRPVYLFLDYDGTLVPIAGTPGRAITPDGIKKILRRLSQMPYCKIAIVSGRSVRDLKKRVGLKNIIYVGNHGFEIEGPNIKFKSFVPSRYKKALGKIKDKIEMKSASIRGMLVEDKGISLSLHYRLADKKDISLIKEVFYSATLPYAIRHDVKLSKGKMVLEVRPPVAWDKGKAVLWLLGRRPFPGNKRSNILPIYAGDDATDEDAFESLKNKGVTIFVGKPKKTKAQFYLKNPEDVAEFLEMILRSLKAGALWRKKR